jgi:DivIVA domain-containing protein
VATALIYLVVMALVAAVVYLIASAVFGRGEELAPLPPGASPTRLPAGEVYGEDVRAVRFQQTLRGYKMSEVDWVLSRLGAEVDELRNRVAELEGAQPEYAEQEYTEQEYTGDYDEQDYPEPAETNADTAGTDADEPVAATNGDQRGEHNGEHRDERAPE